MKGKMGVENARRRLETANEHIDRLTDQLAEAKLRARQVEAEARRVPALVREAAALRLQSERVTSPVMERLQVSHDAEIEEWKKRLTEALEMLKTTHEHCAHFTYDQLERARVLSACVGFSFFRTDNRNSRRNVQHNIAGLLRAVDSLQSKGLPLS